MQSFTQISALGSELRVRPPSRRRAWGHGSPRYQAVLVGFAIFMASPGLAHGQEAASTEETSTESGEAQQAQRIAVLTEEERQQQAQQLYAAGEQAFFEQEYEQAVQMWRRAFELCGHPGLVYNMGTAEMHQGHRREAIRLYREFLVLAAETAAFAASITSATGVPPTAGA